MTLIRITSPTLWSEQCDWVAANCEGYNDVTYWSAWQIGQADIEIWVKDQDAVMFLLRWASE